MKLVRKTEAGFTLLELLVVVAIIGFLVAVLLPRFGGMSKMAKDKTTKDNLLAINKYMQGMNISSGGLFVNNPLNLVDHNAAGGIIVALTPEDAIPLGFAMGSLATDFVDGFKPTLHKLSLNEVNELKTMSITSVQNWYDLIPLTNKKYETTPLATGTEVVMCGAGDSDGGGWVATDVGKIDTVGTDWIKDWKQVYKILVGWAGEKFQPYDHGVEPGTGKINKNWGDMYSQDFAVFALPRLDSTIRNINNSPANATAPGYVCVKEFEGFDAVGDPDLEASAEEKPVDLTVTFHKYGMENQLTQAGTVWPGGEEEFSGETKKKWVLIDGNSSVSCGFAGMGAPYLPVSSVITMYGYH